MRYSQEEEALTAPPSAGVDASPLRLDAAQLEQWGDVRRDSERRPETVTVLRPQYLPGVEIWAVRASPRLWTMLHELHSFSGQDIDNAHWQRTRLDVRNHGRPLRLTGTDMLVGTLGELSRITEMAAPLYFHAINVLPCAASEWLPRQRELSCAQLREPRLHQLFSAAWRAVEASQLDVTEREHHLRGFLAEAFALAAPGGQRRPARICSRSVRRARELVNDRFADGITLAEIARHAECSVWHLERSFHASVGLPLHVYLQQVRLARARSLLRQGARASQAAMATGFADQPHMIRTFRKWLGLTPRAFFRRR